MDSGLRTLIDFATGENWDMPAALYASYERELPRLAAMRNSLPDQTVIQY